MLGLTDGAAAIAAHFLDEQYPTCFGFLIFSNWFEVDNLAHPFASSLTTSLAPTASA